MCTIKRSSMNFAILVLAVALGLVAGSPSARLRREVGGKSYDSSLDPVADAVKEGNDDNKNNKDDDDDDDDDDDYDDYDDDDEYGGQNRNDKPDAMRVKVGKDNDDDKDSNKENEKKAEDKEDESKVNKDAENKQEEKEDAEKKGAKEEAEKKGEKEGEESGKEEEKKTKEEEAADKEETKDDDKEEDKTAKGKEESESNAGKEGKAGAIKAPIPAGKIDEMIDIMNTLNQQFAKMIASWDSLAKAAPKAAQEAGNEDEESSGQAEKKDEGLKKD